MLHLRPLRPALFALTLLPLAACDTAEDVTSVAESIPAYAEQEPNDDEVTANDFGTLYPGDLFFIQGHSTDDGSDPFDGFSFVAGSPIHVDFRLFDEPYTGDLDVWLYDPAIGEVVGYFETENHPELGGVDVVDAGLEFHLIVSSFLGHSDYDLELAVSALAPAATARGSESTAGAGRIARTESSGTSQAVRGHRLQAADYRVEAAARPVAHVEGHIEPGFTLLVLERYTAPGTE